MRFAKLLLLSCLAVTSLPSRASAQGFPFGEWGDAPNGWAAYWDNGVGGQFPTCLGSSFGFIYHTPNAPFFDGVTMNCYFGMGCDYELDGNAGVCSEPYDLDECYGQLDGDAGLTMPTAYTYGPTHQLITCSGLPPTSIGNACEMARWGRDIDIGINNNLPFDQPAYLNVMFDWDRDGQWAISPVGPIGCGFTVPEHVIQNMPIPPNFHGLASMIGLADFPIGPDSGVVWVRFSITIAPLPYPYQFPYIVEYGETEDYLVHINAQQSPVEMGDAPQGVVAYPQSGVIGKFPTCQSTPSRLVHSYDAGLYMGPGADHELDGNHDNCAFNPYDNDECFQDGDAGLIAPRPFSISAATHNVVPCNGPPGTIGQSCQSIVWGAGLDMQVTNSLPSGAYFNVLADWDGSGTWDSHDYECAPGMHVKERVVSNYFVNSGFSGPISQLAPPPVVTGPPGFVWVRFTLSTIPAPIAWNGGGDLGDGETEDYLLRVGGSLLDAGSTSGPVHVGEPWPNPARGITRLGVHLANDTDVGAIVYDVNGRTIRDLGVLRESAGIHEVQWDGLNSRSLRPPAGVYFIHVRIGSEVHVRRVIMIP